MRATGQGVDIPDWMVDWPISHPGSKESTQPPDQDIKPLCKDAVPLKEADVFAEGEDRIEWDYAIQEYVIPPEDTTYVDVRFNFPVRHHSEMHQARVESFPGSSYNLGWKFFRKKECFTWLEVKPLLTTKIWYIIV